jgi:dethiobiotin synthetase
MSADPIDYASLLAETRSARSDPAVGVLEGAGGLRVPLTDDPRHEIVDLIADAADAALVVARSGPVTLNHTALTVEALRPGTSTLPASR